MKSILFESMITKLTETEFKGALSSGDSISKLMPFFEKASSFKNPLPTLDGKEITMDTLERYFSKFLSKERVLIVFKRSLNTAKTDYIYEYFYTNVYLKNGENLNLSFKNTDLKERTIAALKVLSVHNIVLKKPVDDGNNNFTFFVSDLANLNDKSRQQLISDMQKNGLITIPKKTSLPGIGDSILDVIETATRN